MMQPLNQPSSGSASCSWVQPALPGAAKRRHLEGSVAVTMIPAALHEALGVVARRYAAQLNDFSARTIRAIGYREVHERGIIYENEAICRDQSVEPITGIGAGIDTNSKGRRAKGHCGDDKGKSLRNAHSRKPKPISLSAISVSRQGERKTQF